MPKINLISQGVTEQLMKLFKKLNISDYNLDISAGSVKGDNYLGIITKVQVNGKNEVDETATLDLIVKSAPCNVFRSLFPIRIAFEREIYIYRKVLPEYITLQQEKHVKHPFHSFAKFYESTMENLEEALIMDDMRTLGFKLCNRFEPLDYNHASLTLKNYGRLHALSFALKDQKPELFQELSLNTIEKILTEKATRDEEINMLKKRLSVVLQALDPIEHKTAYERFKGFQKDYMSKLHRVLKFEEAGEYAVIGHGDCWINNMLFKYGDAQNPTVPTEVCFLDWQLSRLGSPALDLGYFIFTCTDKDLRDEHYEDLINEYYNSFSSFLRELGSDPEKLFPYKVLQEHLKRFSVYGLFMAVMILYFISSDNDELPDVNKIQDIEDAKKQFSYVSKNIDKYRSRIRGVVLDFVKYDYYF